MSDKALPDENSDYSLPGRNEESDIACFVPPVESKPKSRALTISMIVFLLASAGVFSYYFMNQNQIDSEILDNTSFKTLEQKMVREYGVGQFGSAHEHAVIVVFVDGEMLDFGLPQFQIQSKYIHFENHNPYQIHRHATGVPLEMLFSSFGVNITKECITLGTYDSITEKVVCSDPDNSLMFLVNGEEVSDIISYKIKHDDRILISLGNSGLISEQLKYLETLEIHDVPERNPYVSDRDISI